MGKFWMMCLVPKRESSQAHCNYLTRESRKWAATQREGINAREAKSIRALCRQWCSSEEAFRGCSEGLERRELWKEGLKRSRRAFLFSGGHRSLQKINSLGYWITVEWIFSVTCKILRAEMIKEQLKHRHNWDASVPFLEKTSVSGTSRWKTNLTVIVLLVSRDIFMSSQTISVTKEARSKYDQKCSDIFERMGSGVKLSSLGIWFLALFFAVCRTLGKLLKVIVP